MSTTTESRPLKGIKVLEIAGLAPAPFCGLILADFGADVIRIDRYGSSTTIDNLGRGKRSIAVNFKSKEGVETLLKLVEKADVLIDPFRPGVTERLGFGPDVTNKRNPKLIYARLTGFGQTGPFSGMAGHDINYLSLSGALSMIGRKDENPLFPLNLLADFAGGGLSCAFGITVALIERNKSGKGQVIDAAMMDGVSYLSTFPFKHKKSQSPLFDGERGTSTLDSGAFFYDTYKTKDGKFMAVGCLEPQFYAEFIKGLGLNQSELPDQNDRSQWPTMKKRVTEIFLSKTRDEWCKIFDGTDACVTPVLELDELDNHPHTKARQLMVPVNESQHTAPAPAPRLSRTPGFAPNSKEPEIVGQHTLQVLKEFGFQSSEIEKLIQIKAIGLGMDPAM